MNKQANRRSRGFTLIEIMVVVALIAGVVGTILYVMTGEAKKAAGERAVAKMAEEMSQISRAVDDYYTAARISAIPSDNVVQTVTINTLVTEALLPPNFANRQAAGGVAMGVSPFGQPYAIRAVRLPGNILTFVVFDTGTVMPGPITRTGYNTNTDTLTALKAQIASEISTTYQIPTGIIRQGETTARGGFNGFTLSVATYVGAPVTQPTAIVLKGFPELEADGSGGDDEGDGGFSGTCSFKGVGDMACLGSLGGRQTCTSGSTSYIGPQCDGGITPEANVRACGDLGSYSFMQTPRGITIGFSTATESRASSASIASQCTNGTATNSASADAWRRDLEDILTIQDLRINDRSVYQYTCATATHQVIYNSSTHLCSVNAVSIPAAAIRNDAYAIPGTPSPSQRTHLLCCQ